MGLDTEAKCFIAGHITTDVYYRWRNGRLSKTTIQQNITSRGTSIEYVPQGTLTMAKQDLDALRPRNLHSSADGRILMGQLENGNTVKLRPSNDGGRNRWTIEISKPNGRIIREIRYGNL